MNSRTRLLVSIGLPLLLIIAVVGAFLWRSTGSPVNHTGTASAALPNECSKPAPTLTTMTLALDWTPNTNHTGIYAALHQCLYRAQGIDLQLQPYSSTVAPETLVSTGKADVGISYTEGVVTSTASGQPVVSIGSIIQHNTSELVVLADSGIKRPRDLDGKIYGGFGAPYETPVVSQIIKNDGGTGNFKNVSLDIDGIEALKSHRIDFIWIFHGWEGIQAERAGVKLTIFPLANYGVADYYTPTIISSPTTIQQKHDLLKKFMAVTSQGYEYARTHPKEAAQMLLDQTPKGTFPDPGLVMASQEYLSPRYADAGRKWGLQDAQAWHGYPQFILSTGGVTDAAGKAVTSMNLDALYTNKFLP